MKQPLEQLAIELFSIVIMGFTVYIVWYIWKQCRNTTKRVYSPPFFIQMSSNDSKEQCDIYPCGSIHEVKRCNEGYLWNTKGTDSIPSHFKTIELFRKPDCKECPTCMRKYPKRFGFTKYEDLEICPRCYERYTTLNRN